MTIILSFASILATAVPSAAPAQEPPAAPPVTQAVDSASSTVPNRDPAVSFAPARPVQGSAVLVRVRIDSVAADSVARLEAELAGEPLHFEADSAGTFMAIAGLPIDATGRARPSERGAAPPEPAGRAEERSSTKG